MNIPTPTHLLTPTVSPSSSEPNSTTHLFTPHTMSNPSLDAQTMTSPRTSSSFGCCGQTEKGLLPMSHQVNKGEQPSNVNNSHGPVSLVWPPWKRSDGWSGWMGDTVASKALVWSLITHAFATGILDATTYLDFNTFASNQTGNTILLTNALVRLSGHTLLLTGVSFGAFISSALVFGQIGHCFGVRRRGWLLINVFYQLVCLTLAAIFLSPHGPMATRLGSKHDWSVILLFASMSGAQVAAARQASVQEIPTAPMTSTYVDLVSDQHLFAALRAKEGASRNRRLGYVIAMISGSFIGGIMHKYAGSWVVVLIAMVFKFVVVLLISVAPAEQS